MDGRETIAYIVLEGQGLLNYRVELADGSAETFASLDDVCDFVSLHTVESADVVLVSVIKIADISPIAPSIIGPKAPVHA